MTVGGRTPFVSQRNHPYGRPRAIVSAAILGIFVITRASASTQTTTTTPAQPKLSRRQFCVLGSSALVTAGMRDNQAYAQTSDHCPATQLQFEGLYRGNQPPLSYIPWRSAQIQTDEPALIAFQRSDDGRAVATSVEFSIKEATHHTNYQAQIKAAAGEVAWVPPRASSLYRKSSHQLPFNHLTNAPDSTSTSILADLTTIPMEHRLLRDGDTFHLRLRDQNRGATTHVFGRLTPLATDSYTYQLDSTLKVRDFATLDIPLEVWEAVSAVRFLPRGKAGLSISSSVDSGTITAIQIPFLLDMQMVQHGDVDRVWDFIETQTGITLHANNQTFSNIPREVRVSWTNYVDPATNRVQEMVRGTLYLDLSAPEIASVQSSGEGLSISVSQPPLHELFTAPETSYMFDTEPTRIHLNEHASEVGLEIPIDPFGPYMPDDWIVE